MKIVFSGVQDQEMQDRIQAMHDKAIATFKENGGEWPEESNGSEVAPVRVTLNHRMRSSGGRAKGMFYIDINYRLFLENPEKLENTYVHELAHIYCQRKYSKKIGHGVEWKVAMTMMGQAPSRCHSMDTSSLSRKKVNHSRHIYACDCREVEFSHVRHGKSRKYFESSGKAYYSCQRCGKGLLLYKTLSGSMF